MGFLKFVCDRRLTQVELRKDRGAVASLLVMPDALKKAQGLQPLGLCNSSQHRRSSYKLPSSSVLYFCQLWFERIVRIRLAAVGVTIGPKLYCVRLMQHSRHRMSSASNTRDNRYLLAKIAYCRPQTSQSRRQDDCSPGAPHKFIHQHCCTVRICSSLWPRSWIRYQIPIPFSPLIPAWTSAWTVCPASADGGVAGGAGVCCGDVSHHTKSSPAFRTIAVRTEPLTVSTSVGVGGFSRRTKKQNWLIDVVTRIDIFRNHQRSRLTIFNISQRNLRLTGLRLPAYLRSIQKHAIGRLVIIQPFAASTRLYLLNPNPRYSPHN